MGFKYFLILLSIFLLIGNAAASGDEAAINAKLEQGGVVHLQAGTYILHDSIRLQSDTILEGEPGTIITIPDNAGWPVWKPLITGSGKHNIIIRNIDFDGNDRDQNEPRGHGYYNFIHVIDCDSVEVSGCTLHDSLGDGLRAKTSTNVKFYNNKAYRLGHDGLYVIDSKNVEAYNNQIQTRTNSALRIWNCQHVRFHDNYINAQLDSIGGNPGIQIEDSKGTLSDVEICNNVLDQTWGTGIWSISYDNGGKNTQATHIHHNLFYGTGVSPNIAYTGGFTGDGTKGDLIENNVFDGAKNAAVLIRSGGSGTTVKNNIITNTRLHSGIKQSGSGYGVALRASGPIVTFNCFYGNQNGDTYGCTAANSDLEDPRVHTTSSGWWWTSDGWKCGRVDSAALGVTPPAIPQNTTDEDTHEFFMIGQAQNNIIVSCGEPEAYPTPGLSYFSRTDTPEIIGELRVFK